MNNMRRVAGLGLVAAAALSLAACSSSDDQAANTPAPSSSGASSSAMAGGGDGVTTNADVFGPACSSLPQGGDAGGLNSMGVKPVATAASENPILKKLVAAVGATNLGDTLNSLPAATVFAPADSAFDKLGAAKFAELAGKPDVLAPILSYHVIGKRYDAKGLEAAKTVESLNTSGGPVKIEGSGDTMTVNGYKVLCGNIPTKNATVFVIDTVLTPGANK